MMLRDLLYLSTTWYTKVLQNGGLLATPGVMGVAGDTTDFIEGLRHGVPSPGPKGSISTPATSSQKFSTLSTYQMGNFFPK